MLPIPKSGIMGGCSSCCAVRHHPTCKDSLAAYRVFPKNKVAGILECQIARPVKPFTNVAAFADLSPCLVLLLLCSPHFAEAQFNVGRELQSRAVEGACFRFGKSGLELKVTVLNVL